MVMTAWVWNLKAWWALTLPVEPGRWQAKHRAEKLWVLRIEFKTFVNAFVRQACQVVRTGRRLLYRLLAGNPYQPIFFPPGSGLRWRRGRPPSRRPGAPVRPRPRRAPAGREGPPGTP